MNAFIARTELSDSGTHAFRKGRRRRFGVLLLAPLVTLAMAFGVVSPATSATARISARLTQTSFPAAQASQVKLVYQFSATSHRFGYVLSRKSGSTWVRVHAVSKKGKFRGTHTKSVKRLFGSAPVAAGSYRVRVSADANTRTLKFTVTAPSSNVVVPRSGKWKSTSVDGGGGAVSVTDVSFTVSGDGKTLTTFTFGYTYSGVALPPFTSTCSGSSLTYALSGAPTPIADAQFSGPSGSTGAWYQPNSVIGGAGSWTGTFDSPTSAHGTARFSWGFVGMGCMRTSGSIGPFPWTATWEQ